MTGFVIKRVTLPIIFLVLVTKMLCLKAALNAHYYDRTCPQAEKIVLDTVRNATIYDPKVPARILRMFFHDCFIRVWFLPFISRYLSLQLILTLQRFRDVMLRFCWIQLRKTKQRRTVLPTSLSDRSTCLTMQRRSSRRRALVQSLALTFSPSQLEMSLPW